MKERKGNCRVCVLFHGASVKNEIVEAIEKEGSKVIDFAEAIKNDFGYCIVDCETAVCSCKINIDRALKVRVIK